MMSTDIISHISLIPAAQPVYSSPNRKRLWKTVFERTSKLGFQCDRELSLVKKLSNGISWMEMIPSEYRDIYAALYDEAQEFKISKKERGKIEKDVYRTFSLFTRYPGKVKLGRIPDFGSEKMDGYCTSLNSILLASSHERGYCQAVFILNECSDKESFSLLNFLLRQRHLEILFNARCSSLVEYMKVFEKRLRKNNKKVYDHLKNNSFSPVCYAIEWFTTCFITTAPGDLSLATLDMIFMGIDNSLLRVGLALMDILEDKILNCNQEQLQMSFKDFVMTAEPALVIPRALTLNTKNDNILATMVNNIQKMNPAGDLVNTLWSPRPNSPNMIVSENEDDDSRSTSSFIFTNQHIVLEKYQDSADSENDVDIHMTTKKTEVLKKSVPVGCNVAKSTESISSSKLRSSRIIRRISILKRRRREKLLLSPAYIKDRSHRINIKRKSVLLGDSEDDDEGIIKTNNKKNVKGNVVALFFEEALDTTKLGLIKLFSPLHKRSEIIKVNSNSSDSGGAGNNRDSSLSPTVIADPNKFVKEDPFKNYGKGLTFSPFYEDYVMGAGCSLKKENKDTEEPKEINFLTTACQPNLSITPLVETLIRTSSFEDGGTPKQTAPPTTDLISSTTIATPGEDYILVESMKKNEIKSSKRIITRTIIRNDGETYMIKIRIRERKMRARVLTRPKGSQWPKQRIHKWPKIKTLNNFGKVPASSRILDTIVWVGTLGVFGNGNTNKKFQRIKKVVKNNSDTAVSDSTCASNNLENTVNENIKIEIKIDTNTNIITSTKAKNDIPMSKGYLGDDDGNIHSSDHETTWVTTIHPFSSTNKDTSIINDI